MKNLFFVVWVLVSGVATAQSNNEVGSESSTTAVQSDGSKDNGASSVHDAAPALPVANSEPETPALIPIVQEVVAQEPVKEIALSAEELAAMEKAEAKAREAQRDDLFFKLFCVYAVASIAARLYLGRVVKKNLGCVFYDGVDKWAHIIATIGIFFTPWLYGLAMEMFAEQEWIWCGLLGLLAVLPPLILAYFWKGTIAQNRGNVGYGSLLFVLKTMYAPWALVPSILLMIFATETADTAHRAKHEGRYQDAAVGYASSAVMIGASAALAAHATKTLVNGELWERSLNG